MFITPQANSVINKQWMPTVNHPMKARINMPDSTLLSRVGEDTLQIRTQPQFAGRDTDRMFNAIKANRLDAATKLLSKKPTLVNTRDANKNTPLHMAAFYGRIGIGIQLLQHHADLDAVNDNQQTPLHVAVSEAHTEFAQFLLRKGVKRDLADQGGNTPLHMAAWKGHINMVDLLTAGAAINVNAPNNEGNTPLHRAALQGRHKMMHHLVSVGGDLSIRNEAGQTPLDILPSSRRKAFTKNVSEKPAIYRPLKFQPTLTSTAKAIPSDSDRLSKKKQSGPKPESKEMVNPDREPSPVSSSGPAEQLDAPDSDGIKLSHLPKTSNHPASHNLEVSLMDFTKPQMVPNPSSAMRVVAVHPKQPVLLGQVVGSNGQLVYIPLLPFPPQPGPQIRLIPLPLIPTAPPGAMSGFKHLSQGWGPIPLHRAASLGMPSLVNTLLHQYRANPISRDVQGLTPLHYAAANGQIATAQALLNAPDNTAESVLFNEGGKRTKIFEPVGHEHNAINARDIHGNTPLHGALGRRHYPLAKMLIAKGANPFIRNKRGETPLHWIPPTDIPGILEDVITPEAMDRTVHRLFNPKTAQADEDNDRPST